MTNYRYHLSTRPRKYICPECGKKTFTPYVDDDEQPADLEKYGRCDRENNCGFICYPKGGDYVPSFDDLHRRREERPKVVTYLQPHIVSHTENDQARTKNPLFVFLCEATQAPDAVLSAWKRYHIGTDNKNVSFSIFWQIDEVGRVRTGHFMQYNPDGHRNKNNPYSQTWAHRKLQRAGLLDEQADIEQCLFGLHLVNEPEAEGKPVYLFESEKTALLASLFHADALCMATSGCGSFKADKLKALQGRNVVYFPDDDLAGGKWNPSTANDLKEICNLSSLIRSPWVYEIEYEHATGSGMDYADHLLNLLEIERTKGDEPEPTQEHDQGGEIYTNEPDREPAKASSFVRDQSKTTQEPPKVKPTTAGNWYPNTVQEFIATPDDGLPFAPETDDVPF